MILYGVNAAHEAVGDLPILVIEKDFEQIRQLTEQFVKHIVQEEPKNEMQALLQVEQLLERACDTLLVMRSDLPLLSSATLEHLVSAHLAPADGKKSHPSLTRLTFDITDSQNDNRVSLGKEVRAAEISDLSQSPDEEHAADVGAYCITSEWLWQLLARLSASPPAEFRLTDLVRMATSDGLPVQSILISDPGEALRIDSRIQLAEAEAVIRQRINRNLMLNGVTIIDPNSTYIDAQVEIGLDSVIYPNTYLHGFTRIGKQCTIGPNSLVVDTTIGDRCKLQFSVSENAILGEDVDIGPFAHLRKGAHLADGVHMGNYGEVKNSYLGPGTKMGHFSYIGDAKIGPGVNIGAGVITANYDGQNKHLTEIGAGAFIGSDSMLIAPLKIGAGARTGAGSVVTKDVPPNSLAVGIPARVIRKKEENDGS